MSEPHSNKESIIMAALIGKNGEGGRLDIIRDQMSRKKETMTVVEDLIECEKRVSLERANKKALVREHLLTHASDEIREKYSSYNSAHLDVKNDTLYYT